MFYRVRDFGRLSPALTWSEAPTTGLLATRLIYVYLLSYHCRTEMAETTAVTGGGGESEDWDTECFTESEILAGYHQLSLPMESIEIVDTQEKYAQCMKHITQVGSFSL